ncbi:hypothetical protein BT69DRAFT_1287531 [Atractiella rhizophila]|nr:hypothetical protein BT69DRAFT_1287529 [Atractiella rhizophila]KAH8916657.1 hypothetical protein BT69DRAFT_1287531 [Atractiella rhizophila]
MLSTCAFSDAGERRDEVTGVRERERDGEEMEEGPTRVMENDSEAEGTGWSFGVGVDEDAREGVDDAKGGLALHAGGVGSGVGVGVSDGEDRDSFER